MTKPNGKRVLSSLTDIAESSGIEFVDVEGNKPGQLVRIGSLCAGEILEFVEANEDEKLKKIAGLRLIRRSLVDDDGNRLATENEEADLVAIKKFDQRFATRIAEAIMKLNGMDPKSQKVTGEAAKKD